MSKYNETSAVSEDIVPKHAVKLTEEQVEQVETIELMNNWMLDSPEVNEWEKNHSNYCGIAVMNDAGELKKKYCKLSTEYDLYFNVNEVDNLDILMCGWRHQYKSRGSKRFYLVIEKTKEFIKILPFTTYLKAFKAKNSIMN